MFGVAIAMAMAAKRRVVGDTLTSIQSVAELGFKQGVCWRVGKPLASGCGQGCVAYRDHAAAAGDAVGRAMPRASVAGRPAIVDALQRRWSVARQNALPHGLCYLAFHGIRTI
ncbi:hypothetical protein [Xanthomonas arboricola]|uniref:hypothetical protein n=1 Tax=Xanthomonas arboricola TaxID=56448 RepID=UPI002B2FD56D|nr:hypothetical protein X12_002017 [Xanthomonas arboricola]